MNSSCIYGSKKVVVSSSILLVLFVFYFVFSATLWAISAPEKNDAAARFERTCAWIAWMDPVAPGVLGEALVICFACFACFAEVEPICEVQRFEQHACAEWVKFGEI